MRSSSRGLTDQRLPCCCNAPWSIPRTLGFKAVAQEICSRFYVEDEVEVKAAIVKHLVNKATFVKLTESESEMTKFYEKVREMEPELFEAYENYTFQGTMVELTERFRLLRDLPLSMRVKSKMDAISKDMVMAGMRKNTTWVKARQIAVEEYNRAHSTSIKFTKRKTF